MPEAEQVAQVYQAVLEAREGAEETEGQAHLPAEQSEAEREEMAPTRVEASPERTGRVAIVV